MTKVYDQFKVKINQRADRRSFWGTPDDRNWVGEIEKDGIMFQFVWGSTKDKCLEEACRVVDEYRQQKRRETETEQEYVL